MAFEQKKEKEAVWRFLLVSFHSDSSIHHSMENVLRVNQEHTPEVDLLAKKALNHTQIEIKLAISKAEFKRVISVEVNKKWQKLWNSESKGRHLFQIQEYVGNERKRYGNRKKDVLIWRLRIGHTVLNHSLNKIGKHESGKCDKCGQLETVTHIIFECSAYKRERVQLMQELGRLGVDNISLKVLLRKRVKAIKSTLNNI